MSVTIRIDGGAEFRRALERMGPEIREAVEKVVVGTALEMQGDIKKSIQRGPKTGETYVKKNPNRVHRASAPGQPPASDTGRLANSITFDREGSLTAVVGSALVYALYLEYGTRRMAARPFFEPAAERTRQKFGERLVNAVASAAK